MTGRCRGVPSGAPAVSGGFKNPPLQRIAAAVSDEAISAKYATNDEIAASFGLAMDEFYKKVLII